MDSEKFIKDYNALISRYKKAEQFLTNEKISIDQREKWIPEFHKIIKQLSLMMQEYRKETGYEINPDEEVNGFKV